MMFATNKSDTLREFILITKRQTLLTVIVSVVSDGEYK